MKKVFFFFFVFSSSLVFAQDDDAPQKKGFFVGLGFGGHFANSNTAIIYNGVNAYTAINIPYYFKTEPFKTQFDEYFKYPYEIVEAPGENIKYRPSSEISWLVGYQIDNGTAFYVEANFAQLRVEDVFVIAIDDPNRKSPEKLLQQIPIIGEEQRLNINTGFQISMINEKGFNLYLPLFANINSTKVQKNYFLINNREYALHHNVPGVTNQRIGGMGYGGGSGMGVKMRFSKQLSLDVSYNLIYSRIQMHPDFKPFGAHHSVLLKIVWG
jgi:hypothetical protein